MQFTFFTDVEQRILQSGGGILTVAGVAGHLFLQAGTRIFAAVGFLVSRLTEYRATLACVASYPVLQVHASLLGGVCHRDNRMANVIGQTRPVTRMFRSKIQVRNDMISNDRNMLIVLFDVLFPIR